MLPGVAKLVVQKRERRMGHNPATGASVEIPAKQVVKARIAKPLKGRGRSVEAVTPHAFIAKWRASELKERSASQEHFLDLCRLLREPTPAEADPTGETYCFERGARKDTGGDGWADVWRRHHFALGIQGTARGSRRRLRPAPAVRAGA